MPKEALALLAISGVIAFALLYRQSRPFGQWARLSSYFSTDKSPSRYVYPRQTLFVGPLERAFFWQLPWSREHWVNTQGEYAVFDVECDVDGLWLRHLGEHRARVADMMLIPWEYIDKRRDLGHLITFRISTDYNIEIRLPRRLGETCLVYLSDLYPGSTA